MAITSKSRRALRDALCSEESRRILFEFFQILAEWDRRNQLEKQLKSKTGQNIVSKLDSNS